MSDHVSKYLQTNKTGREREIAETCSSHFLPQVDVYVCNVNDITHVR